MTKKEQAGRDTGQQTLHVHMLTSPRSAIDTVRQLPLRWEYV